MGTKRTIAELVTLARRSQGDELRAALRGSSDTKLDTLAEELEEKKLFPAAEVVRRELIDRQPRDPSRWLTLGYNVYYLQRQAERADELFTEALRKVPGNVDLIAMRGLNLSWALHRYAEARPLFERALKANPGDAVTRVNLASCFVGLGKADEALTHTNRAADDAENEEDDEHRNAILENTTALVYLLTSSAEERRSKLRAIARLVAAGRRVEDLDTRVALARKRKGGSIPASATRTRS